MSFWENKIYSKNKMLNKYPNTTVISFILNKFGNLSVEERSKIKILDLGCGAGNNTQFLCENGFDTYGIDISPTVIDFTKEKLNKLNLKANLICCDFMNLPYQDNFFDLVIDRGCLTCSRNEDLNSVLKNIKRILKANGTLKTFDFFNEFCSDDFKKDFTEHAGNINFSKDCLKIFSKYFMVQDVQRHDVTNNNNKNINFVSYYDITCINSL